jgi:hypothetical protein
LLILEINFKKLKNIILINFQSKPLDAELISQVHIAKRIVTTKVAS